MANTKRSHRFAATAVLSMTFAGLGDWIVPQGAHAHGSAAPTYAAGKAAAAQLVAQARGPVKFVSPGPRINVKSLRGKTLWIISADLSIPFHQRIVAGFETAAHTAGLKTQKFDGKGQTAEAARGIQEAVGQHAAGIALISVDPKYVSAAVQQANSAHVPIIGILNTDARGKPQPGTAGEATIDYTGSGILLAAYAIATTNSPVHGYYANVSQFTVMGFLQNGIYAGFKKYCPSACSIGSYDMQIANFKNQAQTLTQEQLRRFPNTNWIFSAFDAQALFVVPSIISTGAGSKVRVGSINAVPSNLTWIRQNHVEVVDVGNSNAWLGWAGADRLMRAALGQPARISVVPLRLFDRSNLKGKNLNNEDQLFGGVNFRAKYRQGWAK